MALDYGCAPVLIDFQEYYEREDEIAYFYTYNCNECNRCLCMYWLDYNHFKDFEPCNDCDSEICPVVCVHYEQFQQNKSA